MKTHNAVFIAKSLDGYIADRSGGLDWLQAISNPNADDMGYAQFMEGIDAIVMGRNTFETVCSFGIEWPYWKPVYVLSRTLTTLDEAFRGKAELIQGSLAGVLEELHKKSYFRLYIDGGQTIQSFLREDRIDELTLTTLPVLLGGGSRLFADLPDTLLFTHVRTRIFLDEIVQSVYRRTREL